MRYRHLAGAEAAQLHAILQLGKPARQPRLEIGGRNGDLEFALEAFGTVSVTCMARTRGTEAVFGAAYICETTPPTRKTSEATQFNRALASFGASSSFGTRAVFPHSAGHFIKTGLREFSSPPYLTVSCCHMNTNSPACAVNVASRVFCNVMVRKTSCVMTTSLPTCSAWLSTSLASL